MLHRIGLLTAAENKAIKSGLETIAEEIESGQFQWKPELEDVHMNIEAELTRRTPAGAKLHTGRSRNDQVGCGYASLGPEQILGMRQDIRILQQSLVGLGERHIDVVLPGYTHLQRAQPVFFPHHMLAYVEMFDRDCDRLLGALDR